MKHATHKTLPIKGVLQTSGPQKQMEAVNHLPIPQRHGTLTKRSPSKKTASHFKPTPSI